MKSKVLKIILGIILLSVSPFMVLAIIGMLYIIYQIIGGASFTGGVKSLLILSIG